MIRGMVLINAIGERWDFVNPATFGHTPAGLGVEFANTYLDAGLYYLPTSKTVSQGVFTIKALFGAAGGKPYARFHDFARFLDRGGLILEYTTDADGGRSYLRDCLLAGVDKTELNVVQILECPITLEFLGPWYYWHVLGDGYEDQAKDGKIFINPTGANNTGYYTYAFVYEEGRGGIPGVQAFRNQSLYFGLATGSPIEITVHGLVSNPAWEVHDSGGNTVQSDRYFVNVPVGHKLVVSSFPWDQKAVIVAPDGTAESVYQMQDITRTNFVTIPAGDSSLVFSDPTAKVELRSREETLLI